MKPTRQRRPDWLRTHHTKPRRPRQQAQASRRRFVDGTGDSYPLLAALAVVTARSPSYSASAPLVRGLAHLLAHPGSRPTGPQQIALQRERCAYVVHRDDGPDHWHLTEKGREVALRLGVPR
jgi:hypothetical protein